MLSYILLFLYLVSIFLFLYVFYKHDFDLSQTIKFIKVKIGKCCIKNRKELDDKVGVEIRKEIEDSMLKIDSCDQPIDGLPLDLCITEGLDETDIKLRGEVADILSKRKNVVFDGGINKRVVPLEATIFLTKSMNPLVNENGEILILSQTTHKEISPENDLKEVSMFLKDYEVKDNKGELIYKDSDKIIELLKLTLSESNMAKNLDENIEKTKGEPKGEPKFKARTEIDKPIEKKRTESIPDFKNESPFGNDDDFIGENPFNINESLTIDDLDFSMDMDLDGFDEVEDEEKNEEGLTRETFYENRKYSAIRGLKKGTKETGLSILEENLKKDEVRRGIISNLVNQKKLVYSANKEFIYIDMNLFLFSYLKLYGPEYKVMKNIYGFTNKKINQIFANTFENEISDIHTNNKNINKTIIEKDGQKYFSFGVSLQTKAFREVLSDDEYDFFRAMPYQTGFNLSTGNSKIKFISNVDDCEG